MKLKYELSEKDLENLIREYYEGLGKKVIKINFIYENKYYGPQEYSAGPGLRNVEIEFEKIFGSV